MFIHSLCFRGLRRIYRTETEECWRAVFVDDRGGITEDHILIIFEREIAKVTVFTGSAERMKCVEYMDGVYGLFHFDNQYEVSVVILDDPVDYSMEEKIEIAREKCKKNA